jgi:hypothetical protein
LRFISRAPDALLRARWFPCSSVLPCAYLFAIAVLMPKKSREAPHTLNMSWLDLNARVLVEEEEEADASVLVEEEEADAPGFDLNVLTLDNDNVMTSTHLFLFSCVISHVPCILWTEFDLNLPLDEFGAVDFDLVQNINGK